MSTKNIKLQTSQVNFTYFNCELASLKISSMFFKYHMDFLRETSPPNNQFYVEHFQSSIYSPVNKFAFWINDESNSYIYNLWPGSLSPWHLQKSETSYLTNWLQLEHICNNSNNYIWNTSFFSVFVQILSSILQQHLSNVTDRYKIHN